MHRITLGTRVETVKSDKVTAHWSDHQVALRKFGVLGHVVSFDAGDAKQGLTYEVKHEDKTTAWYEACEVVPCDSCSYTPAERADMLVRMRSVSDNFYRHAADAGCHALIEYTGLMNEYIKVCAEAHARGEQFPFSNTHTGLVLPFKPYHLAYLAEKLNCIYGPALLSDEDCRSAFINTLFDGAFKLVPVEDPHP
jgi:hypothetical protein